MNRPSHAMLQQTVDDTLAAEPTSRWRWLFTPDPRWLNTVNTTALRTVNAVRMFVGVTLLFSFTFAAVTGYALTRCGILIRMLDHTVFQLLPPPGKLSVADWRLCEESLATARMLDFCSSLFNSYSLLLAAMGGIALGAMAVKRSTDTEHRVKVETAKKAPVVVVPPTSEHPAQPQTEVNVNVPGKPQADDYQPPEIRRVPTIPVGGTDRRPGIRQTDAPTEDRQWATGDGDEGLL